MERRDYFKKQIDQLGQVLQKLLGDLLMLRKAGKGSEAKQFVSAVMEKELQLSHEKLITLPPEELLLLLNKEKKLNIDHLNSLAAICYETAAMLEEQNNMAEAAPWYEKALVLYEFLTLNDTVYSLDRHFRIENIRRILTFIL